MGPRHASSRHGDGNAPRCWHLQGRRLPDRAVLVVAQRGSAALVARDAEARAQAARDGAAVA